MQWLDKLDGVLDAVLLQRNDNSEDFDAQDYYNNNHDDDDDDPFDEYELDQQYMDLHEQLQLNAESLAHGVEDQLLIRQRHYVGGLPRPGVIRPVLREHSDDSSFMETDDENDLDDDDDDDQEVQNEDSHNHDDTYSQSQSRSQNEHNPNAFKQKRGLIEQTSAPREIQTLAQSPVRLSPLLPPSQLIQRLSTTKQRASNSNRINNDHDHDYYTRINGQTRDGRIKPRPPPMHAFPEPIYSPMRPGAKLTSGDQLETQSLSPLTSPLPLPYMSSLPPPPPPRSLPPPLPPLSHVGENIKTVDKDDSVENNHETWIVHDEGNATHEPKETDKATYVHLIEEDFNDGMEEAAMDLIDTQPIDVTVIETNAVASINDLVLFDDNDDTHIMPVKSIDMCRDSYYDTDLNNYTLDNNRDDDIVTSVIKTANAEDNATRSDTKVDTVVIPSTAKSFIPTNLFRNLGLVPLSQSTPKSNTASPAVASSLEGESKVDESLIETVDVANDTTTDTDNTNYAIEGMQATFGDFLPAATFKEENEEDGSAMTSMTDLEGHDYIVDSPISWDARFEGETIVPTFEPNMNCHGVVHVKLIRVQHLPCSEDSSLQAIFSLPPWKGRIRSEKVVTYKGPSKAGVCARWDKDKKSTINGTEKEEDLDPWMDNDENERENEIACISMVHTYNSEDTPVPNISIELKDLALMFERDICSLTLSCEPLMGQPGTFLRRWCSATKPKVSGKEQSNPDNMAPLSVFLIEACFEPTNFGETQSDGGVENDLESEVIDQMIHEGEEKDPCDTQDTPENTSLAQNSVKTKMSLRQVSKRRLKSRPHMFINYSSLRPTYCALCSTMIAWKLKGYHCEICKLDCCADCQLRIDVDLPCGSEKAKESVQNLAESKFTLSKIYEAVAPKKEVDCEPTAVETYAEQVTTSSGGKRDWIDGVGTFTIRINRGCLFRHCFPPEADLNHILEASDRWLRSGDYYARVSWTDSTKTRRTKTVFQSAKPRFDSDDIVITSLHYGTEFKIEVVDASTDQAIGSKLLTTQGLLQWQRDDADWGLSLSSVMNEEPVRLERRKVCLELRTNVKTGFGLDFYSTGKLSETSRTGEITGWIEVDLSFKENPDLYSMSHPRPCPPRPSDDFNMEIIQLHIARITALVEDFKRFLDCYMYIVSWKNPALTSLSLLMFAATCFRFNAEYTGSLPFLFLIIFMLHSGQMRKKGSGFKVRLLKKETEAKVKEMRGATIKYRQHRPVGELEISVIRGRNLVPQLGIPGSLVSTIMWDPLKFADESFKGSMIESDPSSGKIYQIGETESSGVTSAPEWKVAHASNELKRMRQLLPSTNFLSRTNSSANLKREVMDELKEYSTIVLNFPILQPIVFGGGHIEESEGEDNESTVHMENIRLLPWDTSKGAVVVRIRFADVLNKLPIFDQILGDVIIPFSRIAKDETVEGWFQVLEEGTLQTLEEPKDDDATNMNSLKSSGREVELSDAASRTVEGMPYIYLRVALKLPNSRIVTDIDKETSVVVAEHLIRSANEKRDRGLGFLGTSINTFNTVTGVRGNIQYLQNQLGSFLDMIEIVKNLFNFTCPEKSGMILIALCFLWLILSLIPTRFVVLLGGLVQYTATFMATFSKPLEEAQTDVQNKNIKDTYDPIWTRFMNFFSSIPTNEDLRRYYFWEAIKVGERERGILANKKRATRLTKLWKAQWFGNLELKVKHYIAIAANERSWDWKHIFCIIQGHRFIWWGSEKDFDEGENPSGQIYFAGHSGLAGLSPLEMRELKSVEVHLVVNIFGRGAISGGQQTKISLLAPDAIVKEAFEGAVLTATMDKKD